MTAPTFSNRFNSTEFERRVTSDFDDLTNYIGLRNAGSAAWDNFRVSGDFSSAGAGSGLVLTTPDGLHTYRIAIDNNGSITTEQVT